MLEHKNVIKFYGYRKASEVEYLFLKYASGGELFDRIGEYLLVDFGKQKCLKEIYNGIWLMTYLNQFGGNVMTFYDNCVMAEFFELRQDNN